MSTPLFFQTLRSLDTLFPHAELYLSRKLISHSNNCYLQAAFNETELTTNKEAKETCANCQEYDYLPKTKERDQAVNKLYADFDCRKEHATELYGALHVEFLTAKNFWYLESPFTCVFSYPPTIHCFS